MRGVGVVRIIDRFDINRHALNDLFSAYADGQSFTSYINSLRLQEALHLIRKEPDTPVSAIAEAVGFTPRQLPRAVQTRVWHDAHRISAECLKPTDSGTAPFLSPGLSVIAAPAQ